MFKNNYPKTASQIPLIDDIKGLKFNYNLFTMIAVILYNIHEYKCNCIKNNNCLVGKITNCYKSSKL